MLHIDYSDPANRTLGKILQLNAELRGDHPYLIEDGRTWTYSQANDHVNQLARGLLARGVSRGDHIAFYMHSSAEVVMLVLAAAKLGAIWIPINTDYVGRWLEEAIASSRAKAVVTQMDLWPRLEPAIQNLPPELLIVTDAPPAGPLLTIDAITSDDRTNPDISSISLGDDCAILWTSGTTGKSKGVLQSHNVWIRAALAGSDGEGSQDDIFYNVLPLYNSAAWTLNIFRSLVRGASCAFDQHFSASNFWERTRHFGATQAATLGAMHIFLWRQPERDDDRDNPVKAGAMIPMPDTVLGPFRERFGIERIEQGFGQSEALLAFHRTDDSDQSWPAGSLGQMLDDMEVRLVDDDGKDVPVGEVGEFCLRAKTPHCLFNGYFNEPEATAESYFGEWYRMGDLGRCDENGHFYFVDRKKDAVRHKGRNISTLEVESVIRPHPDVADAAAFGIRSDDLASESELAIQVVLKPDSRLTHEELAAFINANAPHYFVPRFIEFVTSLPYTPTNKVQKFLLRERGVGPHTWDLTKSEYTVVR